MKALMYLGAKDIKLVDIEKPKPKPGEVCIKIKAVSICGSDLSGYKGSNSMRVAPLVMGHEFSGDITELGEGAGQLHTGMRVTVNPNLNCGKCPNCLDGKKNLCDFRLNVGTTMKMGSYNGAMAEYVCVPEKAVIPLPDSVSYNDAAVIEPLAVSLHAAKKAGNLKGKTVVIIGAGPIGLLALQCIKSMEVKAGIVTDVIDERLETAVKCGAAAVFNSKNGAVEKIREMTGGVGVDAVLDAVGIPASVNQGIEIVRNGGTIVLIGMASETVEFEYKKVVSHEINLSGSYTYIGEMQEAVNLIAAGKISLKEIITTIAPLEKGPEIFAGLASGNPKDIKAILTV